MPDEEDVRLNLNGSIQDLANAQQYNNTTQNTGFQTNTVVSNMSPNSVGKSNTGNQPFTPTQFAKLMDALATMTNRLESAHRRTHTILEKMQISLATRLESIYKQMMVMNKRSAELNKRQMELQKQAESNTKDVTFRLTGMLGTFGEDFRKGVLNMQRLISTENPAEAARTSMIRLLGSAKFLRGFIGYEAEEFKGKMRPMPFTLELYQIILHMPKYFDTMSQNIIKTEKFMQKGILESRHKEIVSLFNVTIKILDSMKYVQHDYTKAMLESSMPNNKLLPKLKKDIDLYFKKSSKAETDYHKIYKEKTDEQIVAMKELKITFTDKINDLLKETISATQGLFQVSRYLFSPKSLFGKLFWGYLGYRGLANMLSPVFESIYAVTSPVVTAIRTAFSYVTRGVLRQFGIEVKQGEKVTTVLKDTFLSALKTFWMDYAWPTLEKGIGTLLALYAAKNLVTRGVFGGGLWKKGPSPMIGEKGKMIYETTKTFGKKQSIGVSNWFGSVVSGVLGSVGRVLESSGILGVSETGTAMRGISGGIFEGRKEKKKLPPGIPRKTIDFVRNSLNKITRGVSNQVLNLTSSIFRDSFIGKATSKTGTGIGKIFSVIGGGIKGIGKFMKFIPTLGPIAIGLALAIPFLNTGIDMIKNAVLPRIFGGKENVPSDLKSIISGSIKYLFDAILNAVGTFFTNLPDYLRSMGRIVKNLAAGLWDGIVYMTINLIKKIPDMIIGLIKFDKKMLELMWSALIYVVKKPFQWLFGWFEDENKGTTNKRPTTGIIETNKEIVKETKKQTETQKNTAKDQGAKLSDLLDYFKGGKFKEDMTKVAEGIGKTFRTLFDLMRTIKDFAVGKLGGFLSSLGSTLGGFMVGLVGEDKSLTFLTRAQEIARERGYTGVARLLGSGRKSVMQIMNENARLESEAAEKMLISGEMQLEAAKLTYGRESELNMKRSTVTSAALTAMTGSTRISSSYGNRIHPITGKRDFHSGIDIPMPTGSPIYSLFDGVVKRTTSTNTGGYGLLVEVEYPEQNMSAIYAHLSKTAVTKGQKINAGEMIGLAGQTGNTTGSHLHFEIRDKKTGTPKDPTKYLDYLLLNNGVYAFDTKGTDQTFQQRLEKTGQFAKVGNTSTYISALNNLAAEEVARAYTTNYDSNLNATLSAAGYMGSPLTGQSINIENLNVINTAAKNETTVNNTNNTDNSNTKSEEEEQKHFTLPKIGVFPAYDLGLD